MVYNKRWGVKKSPSLSLLKMYTFSCVETDNNRKVLSELGFRKSGLSYLIKNKKECLENIF